MSFPSPSRGAAIEIWQSKFDNTWKARVDLVTKGRRTELYTQPREAGIYFVHVYWSLDEAKVGVVATGFAIFNLAADVKSGRSIPFELIRKDVDRSIREEYRIPNVVDAVDWATESDACNLFSKKHPEIRLSYQSR